MKFIVLMFTIFLALQNNCSGQTRSSNKNTKKDTNVSKTTKIKKDKKVNTKSNLKILASNSYSGVEEPFIFVARDKQSLEKLSNLPLNKIEFKDEIDFEKNIVVAAFAGMFRTGGYSVEFEQTGEKVFVKLNAPPKDAMVTQALTQPFAAALVPIKEGKSLNLEVSGVWKNKVENYSVKSGNFEFSGGIAGIIKQFEIDGTIQVYRLNNFVTLILDLKGKGTESERKLFEIVSGELKDNSLTVMEIEGGSFIENPHPPLKLSSNFSDGKLSVKLTAKDEKSPVRDGFSGEGSLEAELTK